MADIDTLKHRARREEARKNWDRAIQLYAKAIRAAERDGSTLPDLSIYNRLGDLYRRQGDRVRAVRHFLEAVDRYAADGIYASAIALCNKVLRVDPDRIEVRRRLGRLYAATGLLPDARNEFRSYISEMTSRGEENASLDALLELASLLQDEKVHLEAVDGLSDAGRAEEAYEQLAALRERRLEAGRETEALERRMRTLDADRAREEIEESEEPAVPAEGERAGALTGLREDEAAPAGPAPETPAGSSGEEEPAGTDAGEEEPDEAKPDEAEPGRGDSEEDVRRQMRHVEVLREAGQRGAAIMVLERLFRRLDKENTPEKALGVLRNLVEIDPGRVSLHRRRLEIASELDDLSHRVEAGLALADCLVRRGETNEAVSACEEVLEQDPDNAKARRVLAEITASEAREGSVEEEDEPSAGADEPSPRDIPELANLLKTDASGATEESAGPGSSVEPAEPSPGGGPEDEERRKTPRGPPPSRILPPSARTGPVPDRTMIGDGSPTPSAVRPAPAGEAAGNWRPRRPVAASGPGMVRPRFSAAALAVAGTGTRPADAAPAPSPAVTAPVEAGPAPAPPARRPRIAARSVRIAAPVVRGSRRVPAIADGSAPARPEPAPVLPSAPVPARDTPVPGGPRVAAAVSIPEAGRAAPGTAGVREAVPGSSAVGGFEAARAARDRFEFAAPVVSGPASISAGTAEPFSGEAPDGATDAVAATPVAEPLSGGPEADATHTVSPPAEGSGEGKGAEPEAPSPEREEVEPTVVGEVAAAKEAAARLTEFMTDGELREAEVPDRSPAAGSEAMPDEDDDSPAPAEEPEGDPSDFTDLLRNIGWLSGDEEEEEQA